MTPAANDVPARLDMATRLALGVDAVDGNVEIGATAFIESVRLPTAFVVIMRQEAAIELALRLTQACVRLQRAGDQPAAVRAGPFRAVLEGRGLQWANDVSLRSSGASPSRRRWPGSS